MQKPVQIFVIRTVLKCRLYCHKHSVYTTRTLRGVGACCPDKVHVTCPSLVEYSVTIAICIPKHTLQYSDADLGTVATSGINLIYTCQIPPELLINIAIERNCVNNAT